MQPATLCDTPWVPWGPGSALVLSPWAAGLEGSGTADDLTRRGQRTPGRRRQGEQVTLSSATPPCLQGKVTLGPGHTRPSGQHCEA